MENEIYFENSLTFSGLGFGGLGCNPIITEQAKVLLKWCLDTVFENYQKKSHFQNFVPSGRCFSWNKSTKLRWDILADFQTLCF